MPIKNWRVKTYDVDGDDGDDDDDDDDDDLNSSPLKKKKHTHTLGWKLMMSIMTTMRSVIMIMITIRNSQEQ